MKDKSVILIYVNNLIAYLIFNLLKLILPKPNEGENILFINTGQIGDLIISTVIFGNARSIKKQCEIYALIKEEYSELLGNFRDIKIIPWNYKKYKYSFTYRIKFLLALRKIGFSAAYNLTAARGVTVDELTLLSGARETYALNSNYRYLKKLFGRKLDSKYTDILAKEIVNEFEKHLCMLDFMAVTNAYRSVKLPLGEFPIVLKEILSNREEEIVTISPFTEIGIKNYPPQKYREAIEKLMDRYSCLIFIIGTASRREEIEKEFEFKNRNVINLAGRLSILESAWVVKESDLFIGNDSGFTHIAKALNVPLIGIIGGGSYGYFFPYDKNEKEYFLSRKMDCFGCEWRCAHREALCVTQVTVEEVLNKAESVLNEDT